MNNFLESKLDAKSYLNKVYEETIKEFKFKVEKIGRKWIQAISEFKGYPLKWSVAINDVTKNWKVDETYTTKATTKIDKSSYGTKRYAFPIADEKVEDTEKDINIQKIEKEINKWMGYIRQNMENYWYKKGEENVLYQISLLPDDLKQKYKNEFNDLKYTFNTEIFYPKEIDRWLGYIKDNLSKYWYEKGENKVLEYAKLMNKEKEYRDIISDLKKEFKDNQDSQVPTPKKNIPSINLSWLENYYVGDLIFHNDQYLVITEIKSKYWGADAMSFGGNADGYVITGYYRNATDKEIFDYKQNLLKKKEYTDKVKKIKNYFNKNRFNLPNQVSYKDMDELYYEEGQDFNIYGGGHRYGINRNNLYFIRNNGMDGDDWSANNYSTGGAGAIAMEYRMDEEIASLIREIFLKVDK